MRGVTSGERNLLQRRARFAQAAGAEEVAIEHQPDADHHARHYTPAMNNPAMETLPTAP